MRLGAKVAIPIGCEDRKILEGTYPNSNSEMSSNSEEGVGCDWIRLVANDRNPSPSLVIRCERLMLTMGYKVYLLESMARGVCMSTYFDFLDKLFNFTRFPDCVVGVVEIASGAMNFDDPNFVNVLREALRDLQEGDRRQARRGQFRVTKDCKVNKFLNSLVCPIQKYIWIGRERSMEDSLCLFVVR
ncbi:unnamed protein product [Lactuca saligna]|uniref:Uncharacterized protein n=1 Tax=Lactuca saligna TaxID=75948 RepID=A0AA36E050_LACSI|nr:unnamed protein product [Lactuca saligna]